MIACSRSRRLYLLISSLFVSIYIFVACSGGSSPQSSSGAPSSSSSQQDSTSGGAAQTGEEYILGGIFALSGPNAVYGEIMSKGVDLAVSHINADGNLSKPLRVVYEDHQAQPQEAVNAINKLINVDKAVYVMNSFSGPTKAAAPIADRNKVPMINGGASSPDLATLSPYVLNVIPLADQQVPGFMRYIAEELGLKTMAVIYSNETLGESILREIKEHYPRYGGEVVAELRIDPAASDFQSEVARVREVDPDVVYLGTTAGGQFPYIIKQLRDGGVNAQVVGYAGLDTPDVRALPEAEGSMFTNQWIDYESSDPVTQRFMADFVSTYGEEPGYFQVNYYNAVYIAGELIKHLESQNLPVTGENLLNALHEIRTFQAVGAELEFQENGTVITDIVISRIENGSITNVEIVR